MARVVAAAALVAGCALVGAPATAAGGDGGGPYVDTVDELVQALRDDPVLVQETLGSGDTQAAHDRLTALADELPYPAYVAVIDPPLDLQASNLPAALAVALHRRIGVDGLYYVQVRGSAGDVELFDVGVDASAVRASSFVALNDLRAELDPLLADDDDDVTISPTMEAEVVLRTAALPGVEDFEYGDDAPGEPSTGSPSLPSDAIAELARQPYAYQDPYVPDDAGESVVGKRWMVGTTVGLLLAAVLQQTLRKAWPGWQRAKTKTRPKARPQARPRARPKAKKREPVEPTPTVFDVEAVRRQVLTELDVLVRRVAELPAVTSRRQAAADALAAREAAGLLVDSTDPGDVVGALVLVRAGRADVNRVIRSKPPTPYRPCFFNPLHERAQGSRAFVFGDAEVVVPACPRCTADLDRGRDLDVLRLGKGRRARPYYEGQDVWARTGYGALVDHLATLVLTERAAR